MNVKICGITSVDDALAAVELGATHIGFIFHEASPRYVMPGVAAEIVQRLPPSVGKVGVFVDQAPEAVQSVMRVARLDVAQLHGDEAPDVCRVSARRIWKALRFSRGSAAERDIMLARAADYNGCECILVDAKADTGYGGTGHASDWQLAAVLSQRQRVVLAGGLRADNVIEAVKMVRPWGIDVSSGVEASPGKKDVKKMAALFAAIRAIT